MAKDPSGKSWTKFDSIADAIDRSHACNGGMVTLWTTNGEDFADRLQEFRSIAMTETRINDDVYDYTHPGDNDPENPSPGWAIQCVLLAREP